MSRNKKGPSHGEGPLKIFKLIILQIKAAQQDDETQDHQ